MDKTLKYRGKPLAVAPDANRGVNPYDTATVKRLTLKDYKLDWTQNNKALNEIPDADNQF